MSEEIIADIVQSKSEKGTLDSHIVLKGERYPDGVRIIPVLADEFRALYIMFVGLIKEALNKPEEKPNEKNI